VHPLVKGSSIRMQIDVLMTGIAHHPGLGVTGPGSMITLEFAQIMPSGADRARLSSS
jgi:hypothetical protein